MFSDYKVRKRRNSYAFELILIQMIEKYEKLGWIFGPPPIKCSWIFLVGFILALLNVLTDHIVNSTADKYIVEPGKNKEHRAGMLNLDLWHGK